MSKHLQVNALTVALAASVLVNAAGIVFFVLFLKDLGHIRKLKHENTIMAQNIARVRLGAFGNEALNSGQIQSRAFVSLYDGKPDHFAFSAPSAPLTANVPPVGSAPAAASADAPPAQRDCQTVLIVYLHGMGSNYMEPFCFPGHGAKIADVIQQFHPQVGLLSPSYKLYESWGSDAAVSDISQNIREVLQMYPFQKIVLVGTSMGGCVSLTYASQAPPDIRDKLLGVVSVEGSADLAKVFSQSGNPGIQRAMIAAFGGTPEQIPEIYRRKGLVGNIDRFPRELRVSVISAAKDKVVPTHLQTELVELLKQHGCQVNLIEIKGGHGVPPAAIYSQAVDFVLKP